MEFAENPADSPKTMFVSRDQWVEEGGRLRLFCEALVGEYTLFQEIQLHALLHRNSTLNKRVRTSIPIVE